MVSLEAAESPPKPLRILLAEDNEDHAELIMDSLIAANPDNRVVHVANGEQALNYLLNKPSRNANNDNNRSVVLPHLILLDLKMPRMDGITTLKQLKQDPRLQHIPVLVITTSSTSYEINECYHYGACSFITKPLNYDAFNQKIRAIYGYWAQTVELGTLK